MRMTRNAESMAELVVAMEAFRDSGKELLFHMQKLNFPCKQPPRGCFPEEWQLVVQGVVLEYEMALNVSRHGATPQMLKLFGKLAQVAAMQDDDPCPRQSEHMAMSGTGKRICCACEQPLILVPGES